MHLEGAKSSAQISGASLLPGKSSYFIGNDPSKWRQNIPQFAQVKYQAVYPGVDLIYYGNQGQLEYDFRVAPGAEPNQIALSFDGASVRIDSGNSSGDDSGKSGDLILSTANGNVRFRAPHVYQPATSHSRNSSGVNDEKVVAGSFRKLADNKIGFTIGDYDHSRELVIDPVLNYSTYLGGSGTESLVNVAVDSAGFLYVVGSTDSTDFPFPAAPPATAPYQGQLGGAGATNIFLAVINPSPNVQQGGSQLVYTTYLGGSGNDSAAGVAVSTDIDQGLPISSIDVYIAGFTTSPDFPVSTGVNGTFLPFQKAPAGPGTHGFLTRLNIGVTPVNLALRYSTYLSGTNATSNAADTVTGLAIDNTGNAFVTGITTSTNGSNNNGLTGFPANPNGFQTVSNAPSQFFASEINTKGSGSQSMVYSTYLGGGNPQSGATQGGGIAIDSADNMYITGGTNFLSVSGPNSEKPFPINLAYQGCLDQAPTITSCSGSPTALDAFIAKITPKPGFTLPVYCTYLGGSSDDIGYGIAVDTSNNAYITGSTFSNDWVGAGSAFQTQYGGEGDAFIAKVGNLTGSTYPLVYFSWLGGSQFDVGQAIIVDSVQAIHVVGSTTSLDFPVTENTYQQTYGGGESDAFVASISTSLSGTTAGNFATYLGGSGQDNGSAVAIDVFGNTYAAGTTVSTNFPTMNPFQATLNGTLPDAFVSTIGASSTLTVAPASTSPTPNPVAAGTQVAFTFNITNTGPDYASFVNFTVLGLPTTGLASSPTAKVTSGSGSCGQVQGSSIPCFIGTLAVGAVASVEVDITPAITTTASQIAGIAGQATANGSTLPPAKCIPPQPPANIVNFSISASTPTPVIAAGDTATIQVVFTPTSNLGYNASITPSQSTSPSMVTGTTPTFQPTPLTLSGNASAGTTLSIATVARPVTSGSLLRRASFYATWLPIGGLSLIGLGIGARRRRRRWLIGALLGLMAGVILTLPGCGSASTATGTTGGTLAGVYTITITGSAGSGASQNTKIQIQVN